MHLVVMAWMYVVLMMSLAEAFGSQGSVLGALVTFVLYGLLPLSIVLYILNTPARKRRLQHQAQQEAPPASAQEPSLPDRSSLEPDAGGHAARAAQASGVSAVGKEER